MTVTVGGKAPTHVAASGSIQAAIDAAKPGDMIIVDPTCTTTAAPTSPVACTAVGATVHSQAAHQEMLLMWKPVRLQGVGAASSVINANPHPAGKLDTWRAQVDCLFGLGTHGSPNTWTPACARTTWFGYHATPPTLRSIACRWRPRSVGTLRSTATWPNSCKSPRSWERWKEQELRCLSKGVDFHGSTPWDPTLLGGFPTGTTLLTASNCGPHRRAESVPEQLPVQSVQHRWLEHH